MATRTEPNATLKPPITVEEWGEIEGPPHFDLVEGRLREKPDVAFWHEFLLLDLVRLLTNYAHERQIGKFVSSRAKLKISDGGGREPDIFFIPNALLHLVGKNLFKGVPPLVIEILSPTNEREDRVEKRREYAQLGVGQYWIVDFPNRRIEVYLLRPRPDGTSEYELAETVTGEATFRPTLFPGLEIPLNAIWPTEFENRNDD